MVYRHTIAKASAKYRCSICSVLTLYGFRAPKDYIDSPLVRGIFRNTKSRTGTGCFGLYIAWRSKSARDQAVRRLVLIPI